MSVPAKKIFCFIADICEISPLLEALPFKRFGEERLYRYESRERLLDICILDSWGSPAVIQAIQNFPQALDYDLWLNLGFAGACTPRIPIQECFFIQSLRKVSPEDPKALTEDSELFLNTVKTTLPKNSLVTANSAYNHGFHDTFQLVDMEGYTIAALAKQYNRPLSMLKIASDYTIPAEKDSIDKRAPQLASELTKVFIAHLSEMISTAHVPISIPALNSATQSLVL